VKAQFDGQCSSCGQVFKAGTEIDYYPRSGDVPAMSAHVNCPEPKRGKGQNLQPRDDVFDTRECSICAQDYAIHRGMSITLPFTCGSPLCDFYAKAKEAA
jgi:hypothetical protein